MISRHILLNIFSRMEDTKPLTSAPRWPTSECCPFNFLFLEMMCMCLCVCMCTCACVCVCACTCACVCVCVCVEGMLCSTQAVEAMTVSCSAERGSGLTLSFSFSLCVFLFSCYPLCRSSLLSLFLLFLRSFTLSFSLSHPLLCLSSSLSLAR